ncbi:phosphatidate cytidylyltransferase [Qipengyuania sp. G39]|uniref:Phosphatidate cytidylyltransferase n=1 Tax=Qipengyuania profundimaris TaxID=3067652 RepID=A0ABT9HP23_9SPHN|nr:phosphatidate cytidylyltransferase [Qipengyuania sp. G39]MDP4574876.1 phosphatidate cytidylyltransferase [Qipengyuania sp. G39]
MDGETQAGAGKRDRAKAYAQRYMKVPLSIRTSDLPKRAASALVMLAVAGGALWAGDVWLKLFIGLVALATYAELVRLVFRATERSAGRVAGLLLGAAYVGFAALFLATMPRFYLYLVIGSVIFTDTFAYFSGRAIGGPKIAPRISPSKTWAGLAGGMVGAALFGWLLLQLVLPASGEWHMEVNAYPWSPIAALAIGAVLACSAQAGDFLESWLKRKAHMKDSSNLIPGHGGVFDRTDGILPVAIAVGFLVPGLS